MASINRISLRAVPSLAVIAFALSACASPAGAPMASAPLTDNGAQVTRLGAALTRRAPRSSQDLYIANILGGVPLYSTGKNPHEVDDIENQLPRVTGVWVDQAGVLYAFSDNRTYPYETIEEFQPGAKSPFFSLILQHYGSIVAADAQQNVYAQGVNGQDQQVIDVYPPASQQFANEYVVPSIGDVSGLQGWPSTQPDLCSSGSLRLRTTSKAKSARSFVSIRLQKRS